MARGMTDRKKGPVAVIGGGWAGCAAAVTLARAGVPVALFEAAPVLGGRARRVARAGLPLDNGQHLLLGAYDQTLALMDLVHGATVARAVVARSPLSIVPLSPAQAGALTLVRGVRRRHAGPADGTLERTRTHLARTHRQHRMDAQAEANGLRAAAL